MFDPLWAFVLVYIFGWCLLQLPNEEFLGTFWALVLLLMWICAIGWVIWTWVWIFIHFLL